MTLPPKKRFQEQKKCEQSDSLDQPLVKHQISTRGVNQSPLLQIKLEKSNLKKYNLLHNNVQSFITGNVSLYKYNTHFTLKERRNDDFK